MRQHYSLALGLALAMGVSACNTSGNSGNSQQAPSNADPLATVNGRVITQEQFQFHLERRTQGQPHLAGEEDRRELLDELVDLTLLAREAEDRGLAQDPIIAGRIENLRSAVLAQALVERLEQEGVSDDELRAEYEERFGGEQHQEYHARHILVQDEEMAQNIIEALNEGADFAEVAQERSIDTGTAAQGGDLGWFQPAEMVEEFSNAVAQLEPGQITQEPVQTQFGWHVIRLEETREATPPAFEEIEPGLRQLLVQDKIERRLDELRESANIDIQRQP